MVGGGVRRRGKQWTGKDEHAGAWGQGTRGALAVARGSVCIRDRKGLWSPSQIQIPTITKGTYLGEILMYRRTHTRAWILAAMEEVFPVWDRFLTVGLGRFSNTQADHCILII